MNFYMLFLGLYTLCILPITLRLELRFNQGFLGRVHIGISGMPAMTLRFRLGKGNLQEEDDKEPDIFPALFRARPGLIRAALSKPFRQMLRRSIRWEGLRAHVRVSLEDAATTALVYAGLTVFLNTVKACGVQRLDMQTSVGFSGGDARAEMEGILFVRLGSLALIASMLAALRRRKGNPSLPDEALSGPQQPAAER